MKKEVKFQVLMKVSYMYGFLIHHAYRGLQGIIGVLISLGAFVLYITGLGKGDTTQNVLLLITASLFTIINPIHLYYKALKQVKMNPIFREPLNYIVNSEGITVGQGKEKGTFTWEDVLRVKETRQSIFVYLSNVNAYIFPKNCLKDEYEDFKQLVKEHVNDKQCKLK